MSLELEENYLFTDWLGAQQIRCHALRPPSREALVDWMRRQSNLTSLRMRAIGSGHSTSGVARPFNPSSIAVIVNNLVIPEAESREAETWVRNAVLRPEEHLIRVPAGITIAQLNRMLAARSLALPNMGSYDAQTISGVLSTGTHGSGLVTGPLPDIVASIEIVTVLYGPRVTALRIEPTDGPTDPALFTGERFGLELMKNSEVFESCVVGLGAFGIATAVTLKVVDSFWLAEECWLTTWPELAAGRTLLDLVEREPFVDVVMTPLPRPHHVKRNHRCLVTVRRPIPAQGDPPPRNDARRRKLEERLERFRDQTNPQLSLTYDLAKLVSDHPRLANFSTYQSLEQEVEDARRHPLRSTSHIVLRTSVGDLVMATSAEVAVPLEHTVEAVETTIDHLAEMHKLGYHHGSPVGIRFGEASRHLLAMHYGRRTCTIEAPILLGIRRDSHDASHSEADISYMLGEFTNRFLRNPRLNARVHWGQRHTLTREQITSAYSGYTTWENQMRTFNPYGIFDNRLIADLAPIRVITVTQGKAWVWADRPTVTHYIPDTGYQYNSAGGSNQISRLATGQYQVDLPWLGTSGGMVHTVAYGGNHYCKVVGWGASGSKQRIRVNCFSPDGRLIDGQFVLLFYKESRGATSANAYLWANQPSTESYTPDPKYQWNSKGLSNTIRRLNVGHYQVTLPGINVPGGTVLVSAYGSGTERCKVGGWRQSGNDTVVTVHGFDVAGNPVDTRFTLSFMTDVGLGSRFSEGQHYGGYIWANQPTAESYTPSRSYQLNTTGGINTITRPSTGVYTVNFSRLKSFNSTAALSASYGSGSEYCAVHSWMNDGRGGTNVFVQCFDRSGNPTDTQFTVTYLTNGSVIL